MILHPNGRIVGLHFHHASAPIPLPASVADTITLAEKLQSGWRKISYCTLHLGICPNKERPCQFPEMPERVDISAICNPTDNFSYKVGREIALNRALIVLQERRVADEALCVAIKEKYQHYTRPRRPWKLADLAMQLKPVDLRMAAAAAFSDTSTVIFGMMAAELEKLKARG